MISRTMPLHRLFSNAMNQTKIWKNTDPFLFLTSSIKLDVVGFHSLRWAWFYLTTNPRPWILTSSYYYYKLDVIQKWFWASKAWSFERLFNMCLDKKRLKARHGAGAEQKFVLFRVPFVKKNRKYWCELFSNFWMQCSFGATFWEIFIFTFTCTSTSKLLIIVFLIYLRIFREYILIELEVFGIIFILD